METFHEKLDGLEAGAINLLVIRSALEVFCAGAHLGRIREFFDGPDGAAAMVAYVRGFHRLFDRIESLPCVTLAVLNGAAMGGGLELALSCDLRLAAETATVGLPEARVGMIPGAGGTQRLTRLCGPGVAARVILAAETLTGREARELGLVQWACASEAVEARWGEIALSIAELSPNALAAAKDCLRAYHQPGVDGFARELEKPLQLMRDPESQRRIAAFLDR
jgi:enoyl-CoA hydratase/carnithine racemase